MRIDRRALGIGLFATGVAATLGTEFVGNGGFAGLREPARLRGFSGGEKDGFLEDEQVRALLRQKGFLVESRRAESVEMVRERALIAQDPDFLWPSSTVMVEIARQSGLQPLSDRVIFNSPIVLYSWGTVADALEQAGFVGRMPEGPRTVDVAKLIEASLSDRKWEEMGAAGLFGSVRILSTDPNFSNSGFMFAGLAANALAGDVATPATVQGERISGLFRKMGYKPRSSGQLFEEYISGGPAAYPLVVGYENQLVEWAMADAQRWGRLAASGNGPVALYPRPTVYSAHPFIALKPQAESLSEALLDKAVADLAWERHGFRGALGEPGAKIADALSGLFPREVEAILPMPEAKVMLELVAALA